MHSPDQNDSHWYYPDFDQRGPRQSRKRPHSLVGPLAKIAMQDRRGLNRQTVCDTQPLCPVMAAHPAANLGRMIYHQRRRNQAARVCVVKLA